MMTRVRSSSRCSTSERRSSCPMGFSRVAMALPLARSRTRGRYERSRTTSPSSGVSSPSGRPSAAWRRCGWRRRRRRTACRPCAVTESLNSRMPPPSCRPECGQPLAADDDQHDQQDDGQLERAQAGDECVRHGVSAPTRNTRSVAAVDSSDIDGLRSSPRRRTDVGRRPHQAPPESMSQPEQHQLRPPRRAAVRARHRGRLLREPAGPRPAAAPRRADEHARPPRLPRLRQGAGLPRASGRRPPRRTGRSSCAAPTASGTPSASTTRRPSTASTRSSTTAPRRSSATSSASRAPTWRRRSSASQRARLRRHLADGLLSCARRSGRRPSRRPAPAPRAGRRGSSGRSAFAAATISSASSRACSSTPVAAIASHTASACSGRPHRAQVERRKLRIALAGEDERQRDRAVEQVGAAVLARALGRARTRRARRRAAGTPARCGGRSRPARRPGRRPRARPSRHAAWNSRAVLRSQRCR